LPLTPTPFIIDRNVTRVWVDDKFIIAVIANKRESMDIPGEEAIGHPVYTPSLY